MLQKPSMAEMTVNDIAKSEVALNRLDNRKSLLPPASLPPLNQSRGVKADEQRGQWATNREQVRPGNFFRSRIIEFDREDGKIVFVRQPGDHGPMA